MRNTELIIFVLVVLINGGIALWKKYAEVKAKRAAEALARPSAMSRAPAAVAPPRPRAATAPPAAPRAPKARPKQPPKATPRPTAGAPARKPPDKAPPVAAKATVLPAPAPADRRPASAALALAAAVATRSAAPVAADAPPRGWAGVLRGRAGLRRAILLREVLGPPRALEPWRAELR